MRDFFEYDDLHIAYAQKGSGNVVVLIHGFGEDSNVWQDVADVLKGNFKVILIDLPGSGQSVVPTNILRKENLSRIDYYATLIHGLLQHLKIDSCVMLGHSMGGYITLSFVEKYGHLLKGYGLVHSTAYADSDEKKANRQRGIEMMDTYGSYAFLKTTIPNLFSSEFKQTKSEVIDALIYAGKNFEVVALQNYYRAMMNRLDKTAVLVSSNVPVLFIIGTDDVAIPLKDSLEQTHMPNCTYIHVLENGGHMNMIENPNMIAGFIHVFLKDSFL
ncbi:alpha/beta fold hydrolase [Parasediminibacterium paludis]|uniref:Alpha/beta fold hydrolase n=1 Tax=Parasediminibacterium paludis TaxID=908966 RepID=A0ABV8PUR0_9BACT